jgi:tetraacyldisaccharide 4'-kinase
MICFMFLPQLRSGELNALLRNIALKNRGLPLEAPSWWYQARTPPAAWGLLPVSAAYGAIVQWRLRTASPYRSILPVICIGNFTLGGAGKTPVALKVAALLLEARRKPAFLSRGYGGLEPGPHVVNPALDSVRRVGDEPLLLTAAAPAVISRDRPAGARLIETIGADTIVMDDGFQNPSLKKDFSLIVVDAGAGIGSGHVFPLGPLRAPLAFQAPMADAILILGENGGDRAGAIIRRLNSSQRPKYAGAYFKRDINAFEASIVPQITDDMRGEPFLAFCGIGRPAKFFETLRQSGIATVKNRSFPDHHNYTEAEALSLLREAKAMKAGLITTEKDIVRLKGQAGALEDLYQSSAGLPITVEFTDDHEALLMKALLARL